MAEVVVARGLPSAASAGVLEWSAQASARDWRGSRPSEADFCAEPFKRAPAASAAASAGRLAPDMARLGCDAFGSEHPGSFTAAATAGLCHAHQLQLRLGQLPEAAETAGGRRLCERLAAARASAESERLCPVAMPVALKAQEPVHQAFLGQVLKASGAQSEPLEPSAPWSAVPSSR